MKIQVFSDLHLEFCKTYPRIKPYADYLFLVGDIGKISDENYREYIQYCSENWKRVFVVLGNHEFYHSKKSLYKLLDAYKEFYNTFDNVELLEKEATTLKEYRILGLTFWSYIEDEYDSIINCTKNIKQTVAYDDGRIRTQKIGTKSYNALHKESTKWLQDNYNASVKTIILTHHPLTQKNTLQKQFIQENHTVGRMNVFSTQFDFQPKEKLVCISGHTHYSHDFVDDNGVRYISNQLGYKEEVYENHTEFDDKGIYEV